MTFSRTRHWLVLMALPTALMATPSAAAPLQAPGDVKVALRLMMQVTNDFARQIDHQTFNRLHHENEEFHEATDALRNAIAHEPARFRVHVERLLKIVTARAQSIADESGKASQARLRTDQTVMVRDVNAVFARFPSELRPDPHVQPGGGARS